VRLWPKIVIRVKAPKTRAKAAVENAPGEALQSAQKYSLVANSVKSEVIIEADIEILP
jgi:hypothetical protein